MKKVLAALVGGILVLGGFALIPLPGPGFLVIAAGLAVLATQFQWAHRYLQFAQDKARQGVAEMQKSWWRFALAGLAALSLLGLGAAGLFGLDLPFLNVVSAIMLVLSGLALLATLVYARLHPADR